MNRQTMKTIRFLGMALVAVALSFTLAACGDEEEAAPGGDPAATTPSGLQAVDLGLPSGARWANMNVGAKKPSAAGYYFAWGETVPYGKKDKSNATNHTTTGSYAKNLFQWDTYKWCNGSFYTLTKYCTDNYYGTVDGKTTLALDDDAAQALWGAHWRMPSQFHCKELAEECTWTWTTKDGAKGYQVTGPNGNSIFLPAAGSRFSDWHTGVNTNGYYWSREIDASNSSNAIFLSFDSGNVFEVRKGSERLNGYCVRPILSLE